MCTKQQDDNEKAQQVHNMDWVHRDRDMHI